MRLTFQRTPHSRKEGPRGATWLFYAREVAFHIRAHNEEEAQRKFLRTQSRHHVDELRQRAREISHEAHMQWDEAISLERTLAYPIPPGWAPRALALAQRRVLRAYSDAADTFDVSSDAFHVAGLPNMAMREQRHSTYIRAHVRALAEDF